MTERQIELVWRCTSCSHKSLGRHTVCQGCGNPKDGSEEYEMPADPSQVASVTDPALLRMATAGANWRCAYCGSDQRRLDGACKQCGARQATAVPQRAAPARAAPRSRTKLFVAVALAGSLLLVVTFALLLRGRRNAELSEPVGAYPVSVAAAAPAFTDVAVHVARVEWEHTVHVERWQILPGEGFVAPPGALDVHAAGERVHHTDKVFDHNDTEYDSVTVPDGFDSQSYTERVACGDDCTTTPQTCRQVCTNNKNGFATCNSVCTGGGRSCRTKYCNETRTRQVPRTRTERRPRQVARYRDEPRYAPYFTYRAWGWKEDRVLRASGASAETRWPSDAEVRLRVDAGGGETERARQEARYAIVFADDAGHEYAHAPRTLEAFEALATGARTLRVASSGGFEVLRWQDPRD